MAQFVKVGQTFFRKDDSGQLYAVSDKDTMNALKQQSIPYEVAENTRGLSFGSPTKTSTTPDVSSNRGLDFAVTGTPAPAPSSISSTEDPSDEIETLLKARLASALKNYGGAGNADELEVKRQEILRKQLLSAPYSEEGEESLTGAQKLGLMRDKGSEYEPALKSLEEEIAAVRAGGADSVANIANIAKIAESLGMLGGGGFESAAGKEYGDYVKDQNSRGLTIKSFDEWANEDANRKRPITVGATNMSPGQLSAFNSIVDKYNKSPLVAANDRTVPLRAISEELKKDPKNAALQVSFIYSFIQALDTYQSAVREGEIAILGGTQGLADKIRNVPDQISQGTILTPEVLNKYISAADLLRTSLNEAAESKKKQYGSQAAVAGVGDAWTEYIGGYSTETPTNTTTNSLAKQPGENDAAYSMRVSQANGITQSLQSPAGQIMVIQNSDGAIGTIPEGEFDPATYTRL